MQDSWPAKALEPEFPDDCALGARLTQPGEATWPIALSVTRLGKERLRYVVLS